MTKRVLNHRLPVLGDLFSPPGTRQECIDGHGRTGSREQRTNGQRQCGAFSCRHNLLRVDSSDVAGKRYDGVSPEWTLSGENVSAMGPSCSLDVADQGEHTSGQVAKILGISRRRVEQILKRFLGTDGALDLARLRSALIDNMEETDDDR